MAAGIRRLEVATFRVGGLGTIAWDIWLLQHILGLHPPTCQATGHPTWRWYRELGEVAVEEWSGTFLSRPERNLNVAHIA